MSSGEADARRFAVILKDGQLQIADKWAQEDSSTARISVSKIEDRGSNPRRPANHHIGCCDDTCECECECADLEMCCCECFKCSEG